MEPGRRVVVQFGKRKLYAALVAKVHEQAPKGLSPKDILEIEDTQAIVGSIHLELWRWMAKYYL
ncbi:MAG: hypothetical protein U5L96_10405 [Owenweeksia sp.]|nr:hypothetical protein [Owenweeksia sp.]